MRHWAFDKDITKELSAACSTAGIPASRMRKGGLPHIATIRRWRTTDPQFDARLEAASGAQPKVYDWEQVRRELLAGHSLSGLHKQVPNMPMWYEIAARGRAEPAWYAPIREALVERERERLRRRAERKSDLLCRLHRGETLAEMLSRGLIGRSLLVKWRAGDADFDSAIRTTIADRQAVEAARTAAATEAKRTQRFFQREQARQRRLGKRGPPWIRFMPPPRKPFHERILGRLEMT